jgi:hypothetical protein
MMLEAFWLVGPTSAYQSATRPNVMIMERLRYAGKPRQRSWVGRCGL